LSNRIEIRERDDSPYVKLDASEGYCIISGKSYPPDVSKFYEPLIEWLDGLKNTKIKDLTFNFKLDYYNTASSKMMLDMLYKLEEISQTGTKIVVNWYYPDDDEDMLDAGEEFDRLVELEFQHIPYEKEYE
jgi:hypothetical protein